MMAVAESNQNLLRMRVDVLERDLAALRDSASFQQRVEQRRIDGELLKENSWFAGAATAGLGGAL